MQRTVCDLVRRSGEKADSRSDYFRKKSEGVTLIWVKASVPLGAARPNASTYAPHFRR